jgi:Bor protein
MQSLWRIPSLAIATLATSACFHATINTGAAPGTQIIDQPWASSFIFGLIPPKTVEVASQCPNGVARVETQHSFLNSLVAFITLDIYTPMTITVTCASGGRADATQLRPDISISQADGVTSVQNAFAVAATRSVSQRSPVLVQVR